MGATFNGAEQGGYRTVAAKFLYFGHSAGLFGVRARAIEPRAEHHLGHWYVDGRWTKGGYLRGAWRFSCDTDMSCRDKYWPN